MLEVSWYATGFGTFLRAGFSFYISQLGFISV